MDNEAGAKNQDLSPDFKKFDFDEQYPEFKGWEAIGFHRPLAGELWEVFLELINNSLYIFMLAYLIPILAPYPEIGGYVGLANSLFVVIYVIFDTGTNFGLGRFIAEYRVKNPKKMMEYINFFIRYQMITGLIQVTAISYYVLRVFVYGEYGYLVWILLLEMQKQYPGMLGIFKDIISGMQYNSMIQIMNWVQGRGIELALNIGFILWGRAYGMAHPNIGIIMGMAMFGVIGNYIDDIIMLFVSGYFLNKIMRDKMGFTLREALNIKVGREVYQDAVRFGVPGSILPIIGSAIGTFYVIAYSTNIAGYITWSAVVGIGGVFSSIVGQFGDFNLGTNLAESFMADKIKLAEFYISYSMKWHYFFKLLLAMTIIGAIPYFVIMIDLTPGLVFYSAALYFLMPQLIKKILEPFLGLPGTIMYAAKKINQGQILSLISMGLCLFDTFLWIYVLRIQDSWGINAIIFLMVFQHWIPAIIIATIQYIYVRKYLLRVKIYAMPTFVIPFICALPAIGFARLWLVTGFPPMMAALGFNFAVAICFFLYFFVLVFSYFPLTVLLGGWDDYQLFTFGKAVELAGPSKFIFKPVYKLLLICARVARKMGTHGKFFIPFESAHKEIIELMEIKRVQRAKSISEKND